MKEFFGKTFGEFFHSDAMCLFSEGWKFPERVSKNSSEWIYKNSVAQLENTCVFCFPEQLRKAVKQKISKLKRRKNEAKENSQKEKQNGWQFKQVHRCRKSVGKLMWNIASTIMAAKQCNAGCVACCSCSLQCHTVCTHTQSHFHSV